MNKRLQELMREAGYAAPELAGRANRLAELIVGECIDIISPYTVRMNKPGEEYLHPIQEIKEHFGIEG